MRFRPRGYQRSAVDAVIARYAAGQRRLLLHLPTGAGKTVIGAMLIEHLRPATENAKTLFVAHRQEILEQTAAVIRAHLPGLRVGIEQGARRAGADADVTVASVQSLIRRMDRFDPRAFGLVICDECHRALAPTWLELIRYFHEQGRDGALLLGMTATPRRSDGRSAAEVFEEVAFEISRAELQDLGFLTPLRYFGVQTALHLETVKRSAGDFQVGSLSKVMNTPAMRALTLRAWQQRGFGKKTIAFCAGVEHARQLAEDVAATFGVRAAVVDAKTRDREQLLHGFRAGEIQLLANYGVLTEGFDDPAIECVLMARPTTSPLVYIQCLGRGLRPAAGKSECTVIDIIDRSATQLQYGAAEMAGLPRHWRSNGRDPFREHRAVSGVRVKDPEVFLRIGQASCLEEVQEILMQLPADSVLAGLDGEPVLHYTLSPEMPDPAAARKAARALLQQAAAPVREVTVDADSLTVSLRDAALNNERYAYLTWHLERVTRRAVVYRRPYRSALRVTNPRALLRSMAGTRRVRDVDIDTVEQSVRASIEDLSAEEAARLCRDFEAEAGMRLQLKGQMSFGF